MTTDTTRRRLLPRSVLAGALALGLIGGGYGIASAANGTEATATATTTVPAATPAASTDADHQGWGGQRSDETLLTGDTLASVTAAAKTKVPGGTIVRVETDADGNAAYEAHMTAADGSRTTVYVDKSFNVVGVDSH